MLFAVLFFFRSSELLSFTIVSDGHCMLCYSVSASSPVACAKENELKKQKLTREIKSREKPVQEAACAVCLTAEWK